MYYVKYLDENNVVQTVECDGTKKFAENHAMRLAQKYGRATTYEPCIRQMDTFLKDPNIDLPDSA